MNAPCGKIGPRVVGLVGGIGSGKSRVAAEFARRGFPVVSADEAGHEALRRPEVRDAVAARWGAGVLGPDGEVARRKLGAIVFADPAERQALETLVFPHIERSLRTALEAATGPLVVLDAAILLEAGWSDLCDGIVYIHTPRVARLERLRVGRGWSESEVRARERAQWPLADKVARADDAIENTGLPDDLARQVDELLRRWGQPPTAEPAPSAGAG